MFAIVNKQVSAIFIVIIVYQQSDLTSYNLNPNPW